MAFTTIVAQDKEKPKLVPVHQFGFDGFYLGGSIFTFNKRYPKAVPASVYNGAIDVSVKLENAKPVRYLFLDGSLIHMEITYSEEDINRAGGFDKILTKLTEKYGEAVKEVQEDEKKENKYTWTDKKGEIRMYDSRGKLKRMDHINPITSEITSSWVKAASEIRIIGSHHDKGTEWFNRHLR